MHRQSNPKQPRKLVKAARAIAQKPGAKRHQDEAANDEHGSMDDRRANAASRRDGRRDRAVPDQIGGDVTGVERAEADRSSL